MKAETVFLLDHASWPAFLMDESGMIRRANNAAISTFGPIMEGESALGASIWGVGNESTAEEFVSRLSRSGKAAAITVTFRVKGGGQHPFLVQICPVLRENSRLFLFQLFAADGSETGANEAGAGKGEPQAVDAFLAQKQKLDCALQLIRTVCLDFNNALTTILGHSSLILSRMEPNHPWRNWMVQVERSTEKAAEIAQDLADFSRQEKDPRAQTPGNLNSVLRHAVDLFQRPEISHIVWTLQLEKRLYTASFDEAKIQQAFVRVLENAVEAVGPNGRIQVRSMNHSFAEAVKGPSLRLPPGHYVGIEIADNGTGIAAEVLPRVFEPFLTTKEGAKHRGLGLAWVYGIVTNHGGVVGINSTQGQGTVVRIFLPAQPKVVRDSSTRLENLRGNQTILFVDDEEMLLNLGETLLSAFGYKVLTAGSGARALELFTQSSSTIDLVITDLVMPGMTGRELVEQLRRIAPGTPILRTSGYQRSNSDGDDEHYLRKPFTSQELLRKVKQLLSPGEPG